jgi:hypothetical protein
VTTDDSEERVHQLENMVGHLTMLVGALASDAMLTVLEPDLGTSARWHALNEMLDLVKEIRGTQSAVLLRLGYGSSSNSDPGSFLRR